MKTVLDTKHLWRDKVDYLNLDDNVLKGGYVVMKYFLSMVFTVLFFATSNMVFGYAVECKGGRVTDLVENSDGTATMESDYSEVSSLF